MGGLVDLGPQYIHISPAELILLLFLACVLGFIGRSLEP